jgi:hypothetical protein
VCTQNIEIILSLFKDPTMKRRSSVVRRSGVVRRRRM